MLEGNCLSGFNNPSRPRPWTLIKRWRCNEHEASRDRGLTPFFTFWPTENGPIKNLNVSFNPPPPASWAQSSSPPRPYLDDLKVRELPDGVVRQVDVPAAVQLPHAAPVQHGLGAVQAAAAWRRPVDWGGAAFKYCQRISFQVVAWIVAELKDAASLHLSPLDPPFCFSSVNLLCLRAITRNCVHIGAGLIFNVEGGLKSALGLGKWARRVPIPVGMMAGTPK